MEELVQNMTTTLTDEAWVALEGAYDLHVHVAPDIIRRRIDDIDLAAEFLRHNMRGFILKSHYLSTVERAQVVSKVVPGIAAFGAIALNHSLGGLNPVAVEIAGRGGCKIVWMPTVDAANESAALSDGPTDKLPFWATIQRELAGSGITPPPISVLDGGGRITKAARSCIELIAKHDMILATGHLNRDEIFGLVREARAVGVLRIIVTHAEFPTQNLTADEQLQLADSGAMIEHCFTTTHTAKAPWEVVFENVRRVGVERSFLSTDLGQIVNPPVTEGFAMFVQRFLAEGFTLQQVRRMTVTNPTNLVS